MQRRDLLKGMAVLSMAQFASAQSSICNQPSANPVTNSLLLWLEGPFAVVLQRSGDSILGVTAFSPVHPDHRARLNDIPLAANPQQHHFTMPETALVHSTSAYISSFFGKFCFEKLGMTCSSENSFVQLTLPCPKNIYLTKLRNGSLGGNAVCVPQDHVLEYDLIDPTKPPDLFYSESGLGVHAISNVFHLEIGLGHSDPGGAHAADFHNSSILACFPPINVAHVPGNHLDSVSDTLCIVKEPLIPLKIADRLRRFTTTLECKTGGLIGGNP